MDVNLKEHLKQIEESHTVLEVRKSPKKLVKYWQTSFLKMVVQGICMIKKNALKRVLF
ncbi:hypothetical protein [Solibacillus sp. R5-41]|uniref:hypothetical protein n=1 Tax=Solibacillus sp. R5-41 TaxID=2048654 RepID=UPI0026AE6034